MKAKPDEQCRSGFTLRELIAVVAMLGLMVMVARASLWSAFSSQDKARLDQCVANLKKIGLASVVYERDNDQRIPYAGIRTGPGSHWTWDDLLNKYLGGHFSESELRSGDPTTPMPMLLCPSDTEPIHPRNVKTGAHRRTYAMPQHDMLTANWPPGSANKTGVGLVWDIGTKSIFPDSIKRWTTNNPPENPQGEVRQAAFVRDAILDPKGTILVTERVDKRNVMGNMVACTIANLTEHIDPKSKITSKDYHQELFNYAFIDGHVETLSPLKTLGNRNKVPAIQSGMWTVAPND